MSNWSAIFESAIQSGDPAHDLEHIRRVVLNTKKIARTENLSMEVLLPAAWLHDCVHVAKNSPERSTASQLAADHAVITLRQHGYPQEHFSAIHHAIEAHTHTGTSGNAGSDPTKEGGGRRDSDDGTYTTASTAQSLN